MPRPGTCVKCKSVHEFFLSFITVRVIRSFNSVMEMSYRFMLIDRINKTGKGCHIGNGIIYIMFLLYTLFYILMILLFCTVLNISLE